MRTLTSLFSGLTIALIATPAFSAVCYQYNPVPAKIVCTQQNGHSADFVNSCVQQPATTVAVVVPCPPSGRPVSAKDANQTSGGSCTKLTGCGTGRSDPGANNGGNY